MGNGLAALARKKTMRVAGLMSGTSADGVDAALVDVGPAGVRTVAFDTFAYPPAVRRRILRVSDARTGRVDEVCRLNFVIGELFAEALIKLCRKADVPLSSIDLVGSHGQTVHHLPAGPPRPRKTGSTLQIGEPSVIAERTGITTVADFRPRDVAAGGEGAPLVPMADYVLFADRRRSRVVQNIGGIANLTYLAAGGALADVLAFDTGPGSMVIDHVVRLTTRGRLSYDRDGRLAAAGSIDEELLAELTSHPFLRRKPPKSTGRETFGAAYSDRLYRRARRKGLSPRDLVATVTAFTVSGIAQACRRLPGRVDEVILCGGGARNRTLAAWLRQALTPAKVMLTDDFGIDADAKEAVSFAVLAFRTIRGLPGNVPSATGARRPVVLGKIVPGE